MRKMMVIVLSMVLVLVFAATAQAAPKVVLDGKTLTFDTAPVEEQGRILVPLRIIFEALGATVGWDEATQTVTAQKDGVEIKLVIGGQAYKNNQAVSLDVPAKVVDGRTLVPIRFVSEALGATVGWENGVVNISSSRLGQNDGDITDDFYVVLDHVGPWFKEVFDDITALVKTTTYSEEDFQILEKKIDGFEIPSNASSITAIDIDILKSHLLVAVNSLGCFKLALEMGDVALAKNFGEMFEEAQTAAFDTYKIMFDRVGKENFGDLQN